MRLRAWPAMATVALCFHCGAAPEEDAVREDHAAASEAGNIYDGADPLAGIELTADLTALTKQDPEGGQTTGTSVEGKLLAPAAGIKEPLDVTVTVRGNTSTMEGECTFPKLKVKFKDKTKLATTAFAGHSTVRIATHCGELAATDRTGIGRVANQVAPWREAFAYRAIRAAGVETAKARPVTITYIDSSRNGAKLTRKAALVETTSDIADRLGAKEAYVIDSIDSMDSAGSETPADPSKMDAAAVMRVQLVEALVGNSDHRLHLEREKWWFGTTAPETVSQLWNMKAVRLPDGKELPLPVDFDLSSVVAPSTFEAQYPAFWSGGTGDTQTQFNILMGARTRGSRAALDAARRALLAHRADVDALLRVTWLDAEAARVATKLFDSFFVAMKDDKAFYVEVIAPGADVEYLRADGTAADECFSVSVRPGTPIHRYGRKNATLGLEEVSLFDVRHDLPCAGDTVWIKTGTPSTTNFPAR